MIKCKICHFAYHLRCVELDKGEINWICSSCSNKISG